MESKEILTLSDYAAEVHGFLRAFELVFDHDWDFTKENLTDANIGDYITSAGTFLNPKIGDESNNWGNRGSLLKPFRELQNRTLCIRIVSAPKG